MKTVCATLALLACGVVAACSSGGASPQALPGYAYARHYVSGQVTSFTYTEHDTGAAGPLTAVVKLTSYVRGGVGGEQVKWVALKDPAGHDLDAQAQASPAYDLSLD